MNMQIAERLDISDARLFLRGHPHEAYDFLRQSEPVHRVDDPLGGEPYWLLTRHADCRAVSLDTGNWTSTRGARVLEAGRAAMLEPDVIDAVRRNMLAVDPPEHVEYRRPLVGLFTSRRLSIIEESITQAVEALLDSFAGRDEIEIVSEFAGILPIKSLCRLLDIPEEDETAIFDWTNVMVGASDPEYGASKERTSQIHREVFAYGRKLIDQRRGKGGEDVLSVVADMEIGGEPFTGPELDGMIALLLAAGNETTRNSLTGGLLALARFPEERRKLASDSSLVNGAVEELLRFVTPVIQMMRTATCDVELGGVTIPEGERVVMLYGSANRDPAVFEEPHMLRVDRANAREHIAFGIGTHHCLGAHMARMQMRIAIEAFLRRYPDFAQVGEPEYLQSNFVCSVKRAKLRLA